MNAVDQLFELAVNMDYGGYYGYTNGTGPNFGNPYSAPPELYHEHDENTVETTYETSTYPTPTHSHQQHPDPHGNKSLANVNNGTHNLLTVEFDNDYELNPTTPTVEVSALSSLPEYDENDDGELDMTMAWE